LGVEFGFLVEVRRSRKMIAMKSSNPSDWQLCVAPMIDVTDRHCRYFHRLLAPKARLYTEMITTGALMHGDQARHLDFDASEHPVALQLGGSDPAALAASAKLGERWGYDEINLNCGCPSDRVQKGAFGACLMRDPKLVTDCVKAMQDVVDIPVTVKHRLGLDGTTTYGFVQDFVGSLYDVGCRVFVVHARHAILAGLSPKENRDVPPLQYDQAAQLKRDFPEAIIVLNGGLTSVQDCAQSWETFDGVMLGRAAWHDPAVLVRLSKHLQHRSDDIDEAQLIEALVQYADSQMIQGVPLRVLVRPLLGLWQGRAGARRWRRALSDAASLHLSDARLIERAWQSVGSVKTHQTMGVN
jgi:tRNA-dihydrouridine synthase A